MPNRLKDETSPYLRQHAENPVDWYPWGEEAWEESARSGRPVLLSIGYAACHWCHVMAHESFEDPETAAQMNRDFVNIKVDREERPDLDLIYQTTHQILARRGGGWPLTVFLTSRKVPFAAGTYFPRTSRFGLPGFTEVLGRIRGFYDEHRSELESPENRQVVDILESLSPRRRGETSLSLAPVQSFLAHLRQVFDRDFGGFGGAPKFPHSQGLSFLLDSSEASDREMAFLTLRKMARGGLFDQIGGGFARYSVDDRWEIPHFEKMLYDNGPLLGLYARAHAMTGDPFFREVAERTALWAQREMRSQEGMYFSSLDADSEGEEGRFYRWSRTEVEESLSGRERQAALACLGFDRPPNFEGHHWHAVLAKTPEEWAREEGLSPFEASEALRGARETLFRRRSSRVRPGLDDKMLTSWNALWARGLLEAGRHLGREDWRQEGREILRAIRRHMWHEGRLLAVRAGGKSRLGAYLDDYAFLLEALLEELSSEFSEETLDFALSVARALQELFEDPEEGGFFFTARDHESLPVRTKPGHDQSLPSGNGSAARGLLRLGSLLGESRFLESASRTLELFSGIYGERPEGFDTLLSALSLWNAGAPVAILWGPESETWQRQIDLKAPWVWTVRAREGMGVREKSPPPAGATRGTLCGSFGCLLPVDNDLAQFFKGVSEHAPK